jgi:hypothetical protein
MAERMQRTQILLEPGLNVDVVGAIDQAREEQDERNLTLTFGDRD